MTAALVVASFVAGLFGACVAVAALAIWFTKGWLSGRPRKQ